MILRENSAISRLYYAAIIAVAAGGQCRQRQEECYLQGVIHSCKC